MSKPLAEGDKVRVKDRDQVAADIKSQLFYEHYRNLTGTLAKLYSDGTASVYVDSDALAKDIAQRHSQSSDSLRQKWLEGLSEEARNKLSTADKNFTLRYTILIAASDLEAHVPAQKPVAAAPAKSASASASTATATAEPARKTLAELEAEEARHLEEIQNKNKS
jgi:hypothetical protein